MSSPHDQTDHLFDQLLKHDAPPTMKSVDEDDTKIIQGLVDLYQADHLSPSAKHCILNRARTNISADEGKATLHPAYRGRVGRLAAIFATIAGLMFLLNGFRFAQANATLNPPTPVIEEITLPTPTIDPSQTMLLSNVPQLSAAFGFEYGGYILPDTPQIMMDRMQATAMGWVAFSVTHSPDDDVLAIREQITRAHRQGLKVLISVKGSKTAMGNIPQSYTRSYTDYVAQFVLSGADAIEIWSEANLDRSWAMALSVDGYAELLIETATIVKELNPETLIISGAPAPTGAEAAFEGQVINDDNFLRQLLERGALDDVDCIGMRYVEGIVPPLATSGDTRDDDYRRYLPTMLQTYREVVGARLPICVTSIGYFSADGLPDIPQFYEWAKMTTQHDQHLWLTEAMEWLSLQLDVPLAMIWNINAYRVDQPENYPIDRGYALSR